MHFTDEYFMDAALKKAVEAGKRGEVPVGAVLVLDGSIYSGEANERERTSDPCAHAEVLALRHASESAENWRLIDATMYVTVEPCLMCTGALYLARVARVVFGCPNPKGGALRYIAKVETDLNLNHSIEVEGGIRELECARLLKDFFRQRRPRGRESGAKRSPTMP